MRQNMEGMVMKVWGCVLIAMAISCSAPSKDQGMEALVRELLEGQQIFFGHQSVGDNIISGLESMIQDDHLNIQMARPSDDRPGFYHAYIGSNDDPVSKIDHFVEEVSALSNDTEAIAFMKLCYIDIDQSTQVEELFSYYQRQMTELTEKKPKLRLIHMTSPLTVRQSGIKALIKRIIGRELRGVRENLKRYQFNELMREHYGSSLFDLARLEATASDGTVLTYRVDGEEYQVLNPSYTNDGGHLNETGSRYVATNLVQFLLHQAD